MDSILEDFKLLRHLAFKKNWKNGTSISKEVFGPMWPYGAPAWASAESSNAMEVTFAVPEGMSEAEFDAFYKEFLKTADKLHRAEGGSGLKISGAEVLMNDPAKKGVLA